MRTHPLLAGTLLLLLGAFTPACDSAEQVPGKDPAVNAAGRGVPHPGLLDPSQAKETAPATFRAKFLTTKGAFLVEVTRSWSPHGADRFYNLVKIGFFSDVSFFRAVRGFMAQFGIHGDPKVSRAWMTANFPDDPPVQSNTRGTLTFAKTGRPHSRATQLFINYANNRRLDPMGFAPIGRVVEGMQVLDALYQGYGETTTKKQGYIVKHGNSWLRKEYPELDYIKSAQLL